MSDDYRNEPVSIGELRGARTNNVYDVTPREMLVGMLRDIDSGKIQPERAIVVYGQTFDNGTVFTNYHMAQADAHQAVGMLAAASHFILDGEE